MKKATLVTIGLLLTLNHQLSTAFAQGTAFTYQGRLTSGANPANGSYDLTFTLFGTNTGGSAIAGPLTNSATGVTNGLFTVTLDFGNQFPGAGRWLEIGVRTNGGGAFSTLSPRQPLTSTPYAVQSLNASNAAAASSVAAANISGTVALGQLPSSLVTNGASSVNLAGTFSGNGAGVTNVPGAIPTLTASGTSVQMQANTAYDATNAAQVVFALPTNAAVGSVVRAYGLGAGGWQVQPGGGQVINGYQAGAVWTPQGSPRNWTSVGSSADGSKLVAVESDFSSLSQGNIYTSTDGGINWAQAAPSAFWSSVASSADGSKLVAVDYGDSFGGKIYTSTDSGTNWALHLTQLGANWYSVASSADGSKLVAGVLGGQIYISSDSGTNWTPQVVPSASWHSVASSADGSKLVAVVSGGQIYTSINSGTNWTARAFTTNWWSVASSADGSKLVAVVSGGQIYTSSDSGTNWTARESSRGWWSVASSADGSKLVAAVHFGKIYTSSAASVTGLQGSSVELQYVGNGVWQPLNFPSGSSVPNTIVSRDANGTISATTFSGSGSDLTSLSGANLQDGSVTSAKIASLDASKITSGTLADARLSANVPLLSGGKLSDSVLSANVALLSGGNTFTNNQTIKGTLYLLGDSGGGGTVTRSPSNGWYSVAEFDDVTGSGFRSFVGMDGFGIHGSGSANQMYIGTFTTNQVKFYMGNALQMIINTNGNVGIGTTTPQYKLEVNGDINAIGNVRANGVALTSDRNSKENFTEVNPLELLEKVAALPVTRWNYKTDGQDVQHLGPMAQDFKAAFGLAGSDDKHISIGDEGGVALAAIQGLNEKLEQRLEQKETEIRELKARLEKLEELLQSSGRSR